MKKTLLLVLLITASLSGQNKKNTANPEILVPYRVKNLWGLSDTLGNIKVQPIYKEIKDFSVSNTTHRMRYVVKSDKTYYVINSEKKVFLPETNPYDSIFISRQDINAFLVFKNGKMGLFTKGKELIPCLYDRIDATSNNSFEVKKGELVGLLNGNGKMIIPIEYKSIHKSWDEEDDKKAAFIWTAEGMFVEKKFSDIKVKTEEENLELASFGTIEAKEIGDEPDYSAAVRKLRDNYDSVKLDEYNGIAIITKNGKKGVASVVEDKILISPEFETIELFLRENKNVLIFKASLKGQVGLVKEGNIVIVPLSYDEISQDYNTGVVLVKDNKKGVYISNTIYPYIPAKYLSIKRIEGIPVSNSWQFGLFEVKTENGSGLVGENGTEFFRN